MQEQVFYNRYGIMVTDIRVQFGDTIYLIKNMTTVQRCVIKRNRGCPLSAVAIGVLLFFSGLSIEKGIVMELLGALLAAIGGWIAVSIKDRYAVFLCNSDGMKQIVPVIFKYPAAADEVITAINQAMLSYAIGYHSNPPDSLGQSQ